MEKERNDQQFKITAEHRRLDKGKPLLGVRETFKEVSFMSNLERLLLEKGPVYAKMLGLGDLQRSEIGEAAAPRQGG